MSEPFVVKHYSEDEAPSIKGNGFDGLRVGDDREEAEIFIKYVNELQAEVEQLKADGYQRLRALGASCDVALQWKTERDQLKSCEVAWQPIETAPRNECVLVFAVDLVVIARCVSENKRERWECEQGNTVYGVSHWMPLPPAPTAGSPTPECGACDNAEPCSNLWGICSRHGGAPIQTEGGTK